MSADQNSYYVSLKEATLKSVLSVVQYDMRKAVEEDLRTLLSRVEELANDRIAKEEKRANEAWMAAHMEQESAEYWKSQASTLANAVLSGDDRPGMLELAKKVSDATGGIEK